MTINARARGSDLLIRNNTADQLIESAAFYHTSGAWWLRLFLVMLDHLHALMALPRGRILARTIAAWKSYHTKISQVKWQSGFFDHRLRDDESLDQKAEYIRMNPVRANLVGRPEDWPHVWEPHER